MRKETSGGLITGVRRGSPAWDAGISPGDTILTVSGHVLRDVVDLQFHQAGEEVEALFRTKDGLDDLVLFEKEYDEDLGLEFERATWDEVLLCNNNCFFCFLKGLPKGMRKTLYMKDDDYRLSFLHGNFVTLTNLTEDDWARLEEQRLSPLNVSVHATSLELRRMMLSNQTAPDIIEQLQRLGSLGLHAHTQIVLCPGVNDGAELERSVSELVALYPTVQTVSVVPVGASPKLEDWSESHDGIELIRPTAEYARDIVAQIGRLQELSRKRNGATVVQCSDEYYVIAGMPVPPRAHYDGFPQYENGIGMVRTMLDSWSRTRGEIRRKGTGPGFAGQKLVIGCGILAANVMAPVAAEFANETGVRVEIVPVTNSVFGERVNVSGLLCGQDFVDTLGAYDADCYVLPRASLDYFGQKFLDSMTIAEVEARLGRPVAFASQWSDVLRIATKGPAAQRASRNAKTNGAFWSEPEVMVPVGQIP